MTFGRWFRDAPGGYRRGMDPWICDRCHRVNLEGETACLDCGGDPTPHPSAPTPAAGPAPTSGGVDIVRAVQDDTVMAAAVLTSAAVPPGERRPLPPEPFFQLAAPPRPKRRRDRLARLWPVLVLLVVLLFFAVAGLSRSV